MNTAPMNLHNGHICSSVGSSRFTQPMIPAGYKTAHKPPPENAQEREYPGAVWHYQGENKGCTHSEPQKEVYVPHEFAESTRFSGSHLGFIVHTSCLSAVRPLSSHAATRSSTSHSRAPKSFDGRRTACFAQFRQFTVNVSAGPARNLRDQTVERAQDFWNFIFDGHL